MTMARRKFPIKGKNWIIDKSGLRLTNAKYYAEVLTSDNRVFGWFRTLSEAKKFVDFWKNK